MAGADTPHAGPQGDGTSITPVGYRVTPAGTQTNLGSLPLAMQLSPDGQMMLVSNDGDGTQSLQVVDPQTSKVVQTIPYPSPNSVFVGLAFGPDGKTAYASGGGDEKIHVYGVSGNRLSEQAPISVPAATAGANMFPAGLAVTPDGQRLVVADHLADAVSVVNVATKQVSSVAVGHAPYGVAVTPDGRTAFVANQGANTVSVVDLSGATPGVRATATVGTHPNAELLDAASQRLYVADGDSDQVSVVDTATDRVATTISLAPYPRASVGTNPTGLALSTDRSTLYVSDSGNNDVDVVDLRGNGVAGSIPVGWYPSAVVATGSKLYVANAKGLGAGPNNGPGYPNPTTGGTGGDNPAQYVGSMIVGTLSTVPIPLTAATLAKDTAQVAANDGFHQPGSNPAVTQPIKHVIYVVRENRTYDQEFGSLGKGRGDPQLNLFGDDSAPNSRNLERQFVTLDNFYADAEVSAQGWNWDVAANSNSFSENLWPANYSDRNGPYPSESGDAAITPNTTQGTSYIWDRLAAARISFRNYGFYVSPNGANQETAADPALNANTDPAFRGFDLNCPDAPGTFSSLSSSCGSPRISEWQREFQQYVAKGNLPTMEFLRLGNDHTNGTKAGTPSAKEYVADNDLALGQLGRRGFSLALLEGHGHLRDGGRRPEWARSRRCAPDDVARDQPLHEDWKRGLDVLLHGFHAAHRGGHRRNPAADSVRRVRDADERVVHEQAG